MIDPVQTAAWSNTIIAWALVGLGRVPGWIIPSDVNTAMVRMLNTVGAFVDGPGWAKEIARLNQQSNGTTTSQ